MTNLFKYIFISFVLVFSTNINAQNISLRDFLKQHSNFSTNLMIEKSLFPNLCVIRQQYRLEQNGHFYGKKNQPYYGETYSLAVKVAGGMYFQGEVVFPWKYDADYQRVNKNGKYNPVYFWSKKRALNDSVYENIELELNTKYVESVIADSSLFLHNDVVSDFGLHVDTKAGKKEGYMVWAYSTTDVKDSAMIVNLKQETLNVDTSDSLAITMKPSEPDKILGGVYIVPSFEPGGRIQLNLSGMVAKNSHKKWILNLFASVSQEKTIKKGIRKNKKTEEDESAPTIIKKE